MSAACAVADGAEVEPGTVSPAAPEKQASFTLACGTALLELVRGSAKAELLGEAQLLSNIHTILAAQQAAAAAAASAS